MSQLADTEVKEGEFLPVIAAQSGVGKFSAIELNKQLAGKKPESTCTSITTATV